MDFGGSSAHAARIDRERLAGKAERGCLAHEERGVGAVERRLKAAVARAFPHIVRRQIALAGEALVHHGKRRGAASRQRERRGAVHGGAPALIPLVETRHLA